mgnify:CR=1 FL=1
MARSRDSVRENKAMQTILRGETPEKRVMVGYEAKKDLNQGDKIDKLSDIMKEARMPWFCPECKKTMKKRLDDKMWFLYGHCFDCQVNIEHKMRIEGTYDGWASQKAVSNKLSWIQDQKEKNQAAAEEAERKTKKKNLLNLKIKNNQNFIIK